MSPLSRNTAFVMNLWTINSIISKRNDANLGSLHGIGLTEFMVLFQLANASAKTMRRIDLATSIGLTASGITRLIAPMEKIGLVQKELNPRDARVSLVKLTPAGRRVFRDALASLEESAERMLQGVGDSKLDDTLELFDSITDKTISPSL